MHPLKLLVYISHPEYRGYKPISSALRSKFMRGDKRGVKSRKKIKDYICVR